MMPQTHFIGAAAEPCHDRWARRPMICSAAERPLTRGYTKSSVRTSRTDWAPAQDMPLDDYIAALELVNRKFKSA